MTPYLLFIEQFKVVLWAKTKFPLWTSNYAGLYRQAD